MSHYGSCGRVSILREGRVQGSQYEWSYLIVEETDEAIGESQWESQDEKRSKKEEDKEQRDFGEGSVRQFDVLRRLNSDSALVR